MSRKIFTTTALAATLLSTSVERAQADFGDALVGGIVGGVIVGAIHDRNHRPSRSAPRGVSSASRQLARDVQTALNHFYFNVGAPDGVLGRQSRAGISQYQAYLGFPSTGDLSEFERQVLITAYQRAQFGGPQVTQVVANHPQGMRGLLTVVRDEMLGVSRPPVVEAAAPVAPQPQAPAPAPVQTAAPAAPPAAPAVPNFFNGQATGGASGVSLASHCNRVALVTSSNGGYTELGTMTDPIFALNEQFCLARSYAIAEGESLVAQVPGATPQSIAQQCQGLEPLLQTHVASLSLQPRNLVLQGVMQFVLNSGMTSTDLAGTARICLSSGYLTDNMTIAIGSALILVTLGEASYGELPGHHLMQGIGTAQQRDFAAEWLRASLPSAGATTTEVSFTPGPESRNALILAAVDGATGGAVSVTAPAPAPAPVTAPVTK
ncbi:peptidoglycan-binding domain-containing protein [Pararhodobacter sp.]|uniref:peptidoglycan-binding domain-containing protein n=1 Tax=Pararhodobacter sp. TaxID=2127056 RepID=UPI002AFECEDE|nr:peptidoglycan-binding domain-containing protein [Pararhodobacter sp.]